jgi:hypothetical protein
MVQYLAPLRYVIKTFLRSSHGCNADTQAAEPCELHDDGSDCHAGHMRDVEMWPNLPKAHVKGFGAC